MHMGVTVMCKAVALKKLSTSLRKILPTPLVILDIYYSVVKVKAYQWKTKDYLHDMCSNEFVYINVTRPIVIVVSITSTTLLLRLVTGWAICALW